MRQVNFHAEASNLVTTLLGNCHHFIPGSFGCIGRHGLMLVLVIIFSCNPFSVHSPTSFAFSAFTYFILILVFFLKHHHRSMCWRHLDPTLFLLLISSCATLVDQSRPPGSLSSSSLIFLILHLVRIRLWRSLSLSTGCVLAISSSSIRYPQLFLL